MKKIIKLTALFLGILFCIILLILGSYVGYVLGQYYRIEDNLKLDQVGNSQNKSVSLNTQYSILTYNVGFGAYSDDYTFFMDEGQMKDGTKTVGERAKGISKERVEQNISGQLAHIKDNPTDFIFLQEVDTEADRSYKVNMQKYFYDNLPEYVYTFAENFHTAYLTYPLNDFIGQSNSGIMTLSKYNIESSVRRSFPITDHMINKLFDLDRCFSINRIDIEGSDKQLVLINLHMSAYDEGGKIRAEQLKMLNEVLSQQAALGNYVVAGGDFNHCLIADEFASDIEALEYFPSEQVVPEWVKSSILHNSELAEGYKIVAAKNTSTCRGADMVYEKNVTYTTTIDGFIVSNNVSVVENYNVDAQYKYSDHNPAFMSFMLV